MLSRQLLELELTDDLDRTGHIGLGVRRLLPMSDCDKDVEILVLRHQINVLQRQLDGDRVASHRQTERSWPHYCTDYHDTCCADCDCSCAPSVRLFCG
jgi:hypothetical protein